MTDRVLTSRVTSTWTGINTERRRSLLARLDMPAAVVRRMQREARATWAGIAARKPGFASVSTERLEPSRNPSPGRESLKRRPVAPPN